MSTTLKHLFTTLLITSASVTMAQYDIVHKTEKLLSKGKYTNVIKSIKKALQKDTTNTTAYQGLALYYTWSDNPSYHIDSAHHYNTVAIRYYDSAVERTLQKLHKHSITEQYLLRFKKHIDSLAFQEVIDSPSIAHYNHHITLYSSSHLLDTVVSLRDQLAFEKALEENTYHSYRAFVERYPNASQVEEAKAHFEKLYFDESVKDGRLDSYVQFMSDHPQSVYRSLAEQQVLELSTIDHSLTSYLNFANQFPSSPYSKVALDYAYHLAKSIPKVKIKLSSYADSLATIDQVSRQTLFPYYNNGYGFINARGEVIIPIPYKTETQKASKPPTIYEDYIWMQQENQDQLITKSGDTFWKGALDQVSDLGVGLLTVNSGNKYGVIHKSGKEVLPVAYENIELISDQYIAYQEGGLWGLASALGRKLIPPLYKSIKGLGDFVLLQRQSKWAIVNTQKIAQLSEIPVQLPFIYDDYEAFDDDYLMIFQEDRVNLMSEELMLMLPISTTDISIDSILITKDSRGYHLVHPVLFQKLATSTRSILSNRAGVFYQSDGQWMMWESGRSTTLDCDSLSLLGDHFIKCYQGDRVRFLPYVKTSFPRNVTFTSLNHPKENYLLIRNKERISLLDTKGDIQDLRNYEKVTLAGNQLLIVQQKQQKGLINIQNKSILSAEYDAIQRNDSVTFTLLKGVKFGIYNTLDHTLVQPQYDEKIKPYSKSLYIAQQEDLYGLIDHGNNTILPFEFDQILYWNDSSALVKKGYQWMIYGIQKNKAIIDQISQYTKLSSLDGHQVMRVFKGNGFGILHSKKGMLISPTFYNIHQVQQQDTVLYVAEKYIEEADFYVVVYYDSEGNIVFKHAMEAEDYQSVDVLK